ncbi:LANO_0H22320g1_1 [Lachancea nothofagi CBS 11611]|uniref:LANO_0H22320g1_1 n=1 Tax=Lachancea nothofagi CBS 11611 TaxID=1266666 RepID=A0A1G4KNV1_9SACH|nr:LANO_0H22320g1_1 [Lachancea nothofagi CBS 11611]
MAYLPKLFLGVFPLYMGVELALAFTLLNKCSGFYGILGLFTGHALDTMQWLLYLSSVCTVLVYSSALVQIYKPQLLMYSLTLVVFCADTVLTCFFTLWFSGQWFSAQHGELTDPNSQTQQSQTPELQSKYKRGDTLDSQSASQSAEFFLTILITLLALASRFYFNFIIMAFVQRLFRHPKYIVDVNDVEQDLKHKNLLQRWWLKAQHASYKLCRRYLA